MMSFLDRLTAAHYFCAILIFSLSGTLSLGFNNGQLRKPLKVLQQGRWNSFLHSTSNNFDRESLETLRESYFKEVNDFFSLKPTDFSEQYNVKSWSSGSLTGSVQWWDELKGSKLTGVSDYSYHDSADKSSSYHINIWMGPTYLVPNLALNFGYNKDGYFITSDYIARGPYPIGSDTNYLDNYYSTKHLTAYYDEILKQPGAIHHPPSPSFAARLVRSPAHVAVSGLTLSALTHFTTLHLRTWLGYMSAATPVEARQRGAINTRDDKIRQFVYRATFSEYVGLFAKAGVSDPDLCSRLGAASTGPISEAYVGGGS